MAGMQPPCQSLSGTDLSGPRCGREAAATASSPTPAHYGTSWCFRFASSRNCASVLLSGSAMRRRCPGPDLLLNTRADWAARADMTTRELSGHRSVITSQ
jgi:hypothetical protein